MQHSADKAIREMLKEKDDIIRRQSDIIHAADKMWEATQAMPRSGGPANRELAKTADDYQKAKDVARGEQESQ